ncbi:hypothetical protein DM01DRAFT_1340438 [Hesseltinella vesiculosa]|uniref:Uncharacterized protein n=1 Tax=Hesseltinella vesiculosa TaxID=101127 RepID=A0A1X2G404_9FUNG|nr:hypothetical protein DM01DRAFT_1340438 [Hesseltinella vesiculosa]
MVARKSGVMSRTHEARPNLFKTSCAFKIAEASGVSPNPKNQPKQQAGMVVIISHSSHFRMSKTKQHTPPQSSRSIM